MGPTRRRPLRPVLEHSRKMHCRTTVTARVHRGRRTNNWLAAFLISQLMVELTQTTIVQVVSQWELRLASYHVVAQAELPCGCGWQKRESTIIRGVMIQPIWIHFRIKKRCLRHIIRGGFLDIEVKLIVRCSPVIALRWWMFGKWVRSLDVIHLLVRTRVECHLVFGFDNSGGPREAHDWTWEYLWSSEW